MFTLVVLTYDAYNEIMEKQQQTESQVKILNDKYEQGIKALRDGFNYSKIRSD
jgi:hypothetical protein